MRKEQNKTGLLSKQQQGPEGNNSNKNFFFLGGVECEVGGC